MSESMREDYWDLYRRLHALATNRPMVDGLLNRVPFVPNRDQRARSYELVSQLEDAMRSTVGTAVPDRDEVLVLDVAVVAPDM